MAHNKPDILIWNKTEKTCAVVEIICLANVKVMRKTKEKLDKYTALLQNLQMLYHDYEFEMIPIIVGALGFVLKELKTNLEKLNFNEKEVKALQENYRLYSLRDCNCTCL